jgi:phosphate transport system permease protein
LTKVREWKTDPRVLLADKAAHWTITVGGLGVIAAVLGIFVFILMTVLPLFRGARLDQPRSFEAGPAIQGLLDEHREKSILFYADGSTRFYDFASGKFETGPAAALGGPALSSALAAFGPTVALGLDKGRVWLAETGFDTRFDDDVRIKTPFVKNAGFQTLDKKKRPLTLLAVGGKAYNVMVAARVAPQAFVLSGARAEQAVPAEEGAISALLVHSEGRVLVGTDRGRLLDYRLKDGALALFESLQGLDGEGISALAYTIGEQSVVLGGAKGSVASVTLLEKGDSAEYVKIHEFEPMAQAITGFSVSTRDRTFVARTEGALRGYFLTAERTLFNLAVPGGPLRLSPKGDGLLSLDPRGKGVLYQLRNPHPEITFQTLFGKVWYEGYEKADYVWQSTGGSDDFESKFSLTPLVYGTIKGTFYAMLFAIPLAILAAIYTSQFMSRQLRAVVKPVVELMAALPSVVLGFLAALVLAPMIERHLFSILLALLGLPFFAVASLLLWRLVPRRLTKAVPLEAEIVVLLLGLLAGFLLVAAAGHGLEHALFYDFKIWISNRFHVDYDQRNSLVVGFAMGFAVIPIIFTICEDALSSVPRHLVSASLSAGATPWQTAVLVVLPVALSGIFSAVMVGFGRAVGETMIVLMATGNTAVMDFSPFNGFRALSANIAVEIPEAPVDGSLYRVLFLAGLLLFTVTFLVNTVAELIRLHLRRKYSQL